MIKIVPFEIKHAVRLMSGELTETTLQCSSDVAVRYAQTFLMKGPSFTAIEDGVVIASAGVIVLWNGVGEAWALISKDGIKNRSIYVMRKCREYLRDIMNDLDLFRVQAHCHIELQDAVEFLEVLGFEREGIMRHYWIDKSDHYLYSIVR